MKPLLIIGIVLFAGGLIYGGMKPNAKVSPVQEANKAKIVSTSILTGFVFMLVSGIMYLRA